MVRSFRDDDCTYLGPFRSRRHATTVVTAIWDAVPIRRCLTRGGKRSAACNFAQLGVAVCPCDGSVTEEEYAEIVGSLRRGIDHDHSVLLEPLEAKMRDHARGRRFEEAAALRDRHRALSVALERRRAWQALQRSGSLWAVDGAGDNLALEAGRLTATWPDGSPPPIRGLHAGEPVVSQVPDSVALAEEADLLWRWLNRDGVGIVDIEEPLELPAQHLGRITSLAV